MSSLPINTIALIAVCAGYLIAPLGMAAVNVAIPPLAEDLRASAIQVSWMPTLYILSSVAFMLPFGKLADNYGRKKVFVWGFVLNALSAGMCAIATNIEWMLFWRFVQGAAGAMIFGTGIAIITAVTPTHKRGAALGTVAACVYVGLTLAPAIGGYLTQWLGWRSVFYFQLPLIAGLLVFVYRYLDGEWQNDERTPFDWVGAGLFIIFATGLVYGLSELPSLSGWLLLTGSVISLIGFIMHQRYIDAPLIRVQMFSESRVFSLSLSTALLMYGSNFAIVFLLSLYLQFIRGFDPAQTGQILLLQALCMAIIAPFAGKLADRFEPRIVATVGCMIVAAGFISLVQIDLATSAMHIGAALALIGVGFGLFSTPNNSAIMGAVKTQEVGVASASMNLARTIGNLIGMSLVNLMIHYYIGDASFSAQTNDELMQTISLALFMSLSFVLVACVLSSLRGKQ